MADPFQRLIDRFSTEGLIGAATGDWGAEHADSRRLIRESIAKRLNIHENIFDLDATPDLREWSTSISHTRGCGGWVAVKRPARIGFDVEVAQRIKTPTLERVCSAAEIARTPDPRFLWCAKESLYKALESDQPVAVTQLTVESWHPQDGFWTFNAGSFVNCRGVVLLADPLIFSICLVPN